MPALSDLLDQMTIESTMYTVTKTHIYMPDYFGETQMTQMNLSGQLQLFLGLFGFDVAANYLVFWICSVFNLWYAVWRIWDSQKCIWYLG